MAQSMLTSTSVNGGRALQAVRPPPYPRLPLPSSSSSGYRHSKSVSVKTLALFGKSKVKTAPSKKVRGYLATRTLLLLCRVHAVSTHACS